MLYAVTVPADFAVRLKRARTALRWSQTRLGEELGRRVNDDAKPVHMRNVQNWESGMEPNPATVAALEAVLGADLTSPSERNDGGPTLSEASDAQLVATLTGRLADKDREIAELRRMVENVGGTGSVTKLPGRWAARERPPE